MTETAADTTDDIDEDARGAFRRLKAKYGDEDDVIRRACELMLQSNREDNS